MSLRLVKFLCLVPRVNEFQGVSSYTTAPTSVEFKTGPGPCGRTVVKLSIQTTENGFLTITQESIPGDTNEIPNTNQTELKEFIYKMTDVLGRIVTVAV